MVETKIGYAAWFKNTICKTILCIKYQSIIPNIYKYLGNLTVGAYVF